MKQKRNFTDISLPQMGDVPLAMQHCGHEPCTPGHSFGPFVRGHYLIHYIARGRGVFEKGGHEYSLAAGQGFLISPGELTTYRADQADPWDYYWFGFSGRLAQGILHQCRLDAQSPVFSCRSPGEAIEVLRLLIAAASAPAPGREMQLLAHMFSFLAQVQALDASPTQPPPDAARMAARYMQDNFAYPITVEDVARHVGLSRSQLFRVYKRAYGSSPGEALMEQRLELAASLLAQGGYTVAQTCYSSGFADPNHFSKMFKRRYGVPPRGYRRL